MRSFGAAQLLDSVARCVQRRSQRARRGGWIRRQQDLPGDGDAGGAGAQAGAGVGGGDAPLGEHRKRRGAGASERVEAEGDAVVGLGEGREDRRQVGVGRVPGGEAEQLPGRVGGDADPGRRTEQPPRDGRGDGVEAQVRPVGARCEADVGAPVHDHAHGAAPRLRAAPRRREQRIHVREERGPAELAVAHLDEVDAARDRSLDGGRELAPRRAPVGDEAETGAREAQKLASPSSGLDALA